MTQRWELERGDAQGDLDVVSTLRPPARAYLPRPSNIGVASPLPSVLSFTTEDEVARRLGAVPTAFRSLLPDDARWYLALDEPAGLLRLQVAGVPGDQRVQDRSLADLTRAGGVLMTVSECPDLQTPDPVLGLRADPARGDQVDLRVRGLPTTVWLPEPGVAFLSCRARFADRSVDVEVEARVWPETLLLHLLADEELT